ncbi:hypothetical protein ACLM5H_15670 [Fredinandcohnia humi]
MECPECSHNKSKVTNVRHAKGRTKRWRTCLGCNHRWITFELILEEVDLPHEWTDVLDDSLQNFYEKGLSYREIAKRMNKDLDSVVYRIDELGLKRKA